MRTVLMVVMLITPAAGIAYHYGPGQALVALDDASIQIQAAEEYVRQEKYAQAITAYDAALGSIPSDRVDLIRRVRLERAKARLNNRGLSEAYDELAALKEEADAAGNSVPAEFNTDLRKTTAHAQYFMTWLQRLEGEPRSAWEPDIEAARQNYKLLAEAARAKGEDQEAVLLEGDLESAIRLARMDLSELQALPLPKQCQGCCSGTCQGKCKGQGKKRGQGKSEEKKEDARGAGSGPPPDEKGS
ncbi:MAG: hypothetical protein JSS49_09045 [Planctomycetes bacterium]|nr:hypothetical protein [Planctomycetota bacterium]